MIYYTRVRFDTRKAEPNLIRIGNKGENNVECIKFEFPRVFDGAKIYLNLQNAGHYDKVLFDESRELVISRKYTQFPGLWKAWIEAFLPGHEQTWISDPFRLALEDTQTNTGALIEEQYPSAIETVLREMAQFAAPQVEAEQLPATAEPTAEVLRDEDGAVVISFGIPKGPPGEKGADGAPGADGYTPQKNIDYWTDADKTEMVNAVVAALPVYDGEVITV